MLNEQTHLEAKERVNKLMKLPDYKKYEGNNRVRDALFRKAVNDIEDEKDSILTEKQEIFVLELLKGKSQRDAYKVAYDSVSMNEATIDQCASRLIHDRKVTARYNEIRNRLRKQAEEEAIVEAKQVIKILAKIAFSDINDYLSYRTEKTVARNDSNGNPIYNYHHVIEFKDSFQVDGTVIQEIFFGKDGICKFKLYDKLKALELLGKHLGMYNETNYINVNQNLVIALELAD